MNLVQDERKRAPAREEGGVVAGVRGTVTVDGIAAAGLAVMQRSGLSGVTARAVAAELGVRPSALYHHVPDMATLLDEMATVVRREMSGGWDPATGPAAPDAPSPDPNWEDMLLATGRTMRATLLARRDGGRLFAGRRLRDPELLTQMELPLRVLTGAGLELPAAVAALQAVVDLTVGFVIEEQHRASGESGRYSASGRQALLDAERYPLTAAASTPLLAPADERYEAELGLVMDGVRVRLAGPPS